MPKTTREKILVVVTILALIGALAYNRLKDSDWASTFSASGGEIESLRQQYDEAMVILENEKTIRGRFQEIEKQYNPPAGVSPEKHFNETVHAMCVNLGFRPQINPPSVDDIEDVDEYGLLFLPVETSGKFDNISQLLKKLDSAGFMIDELDLAGFQDSDDMRIRFRVARPVKHADVNSFRPRGR
jgi:hypothetical protein